MRLDRTRAKDATSYNNDAKLIVGDVMRVYHWVAILAVGALLTASAAAVLASQKSAESDDVRATAVKNDPSPSLIRESQLRQPPAAAPATPAPQQRVETTTYDAWVVVCQDSVGSTAKKTCNASLRVMSQGGNQRQRQLILNWQIGLNKDSHFVTTFQVPPVVAIKKNDRVVGGPLMIQNGLELKFGNGTARRINFLWCGPQQCFAEALIDDAFVKDALANTQATVTVYTLGEEPKAIQLPIKGIDKAISLTRK
jgi:invasion protein IalB